MKTIKKYIQLPILILLVSASSFLSAETVTYYINDVTGSPIAAMEQSGSVIWRESYNPYGEGRKKPSQNTDDVGFTGHQKDDFTGLTYMQARYYDPIVGRFYGVDPVGFSNVHNFNRYAYANNNPYKFTDPDGQLAILNANTRGMSLKQTMMIHEMSKTALKAGGVSAGVATAAFVAAEAAPILANSPQAMYVSARISATSIQVNAAVLSGSIAVSQQLNKIAPAIGNVINNIKQTVTNVVSKVLTSPIVSNPAVTSEAVAIIEGTIPGPATTKGGVLGSVAKEVIKNTLEDGK